MVDVSYALILDAIRTVGIVAGIVYYLSILRNQQKARMMDMVSRRTEQVNNIEYQRMVRRVGRAGEDWSTPDEYYEKFNPLVEQDFGVERSIVQNNLNHWGFLFREGFIDEEFVERLYHPWHIINFWETYGVLLLQEREEAGIPTLFSDLEYLYDAMKKKYPHLSKDTRFSFRGWLQE